jgi:XTP/dITP diphosphohydrolase
VTDDQGTVVFLASRNARKLAEMQRILGEAIPGIRVLGLDDVASYDEPAETEPTFEGNARIKALAAVAATGLPSLADDSGLCVDALNGMPGVLSARWSGLRKAPGVDVDLANNQLLLAQLDDVPDERRGAEFHCAVVFAYPVGAAGVVAEAVDGVMRGRVIRAMRGSGGFGYDVLFCADGHDVTTAEMPADEKDAISHRGKALRAVAPIVQDVLVGL